jgi:hypothetical protein
VLRVVVLENLKSLGVVQGVLSRVGHGVTVGDGHDRYKKKLLKGLRRVRGVSLKETDRRSQ